MLPEIELLEHHRELGADAVHLLHVGRRRRAVPLAHLDQLALHPHLAAVRRLEEVDAAQESRLARARGPEDRNHVMLVRGQRYALEHLVGAEASGSPSRRGPRGPRSGFRPSPPNAPRPPLLPAGPSQRSVSAGKSPAPAPAAGVLIPATAVDSHLADALVALSSRCARHGTSPISGRVPVSRGSSPAAALPDARVSLVESQLEEVPRSSNRAVEAMGLANVEAVPVACRGVGGRDGPVATS